MDAASPQDVYARHLVSRRGYPLWTPEPSLTLPSTYREGGLKIGDVGVVVPEDGSFDVFFNICLPSGHSLHRHTGVPNDFKPILLEERDIAIFPEAECAGRVIAASSVTRIGRQSSGSENTTRNTQLGPLNFEFTLSSKEGAILILPEGAERYYLRNQRPFLEEAIRHAVDWYNFAEQRLGRIISHDSLYLITGFCKARSWAVASYEQSSGAGGVYAQFKATQVGGGDVTTSYSWETTHALDWRVGPSNQYYNGIPNQSVFIQGFKIAVRTNILGAKRVRVKAEPPVVRPPPAAAYAGSRWPNVGAMSLPSRSSAPPVNEPKESDADTHVDLSEGNSDSESFVEDTSHEIIIQHVPQVSKPFHPSDIINQYLLELDPSASIAITHDSRWCTLLEDGIVQPEELVQEGCLGELVPSMVPMNLEGAVYLEDISALEDVLNASPGPLDLHEGTPSSSPEIMSSGSMPKEQPVNDPTNLIYASTTPKPQKLSLPEESLDYPFRPDSPSDVWRPQTPTIPPSSSTTKPLKSILKGSKYFPSSYLNLNKDETLSAKKIAHSVSSNILPPTASMASMKLSELRLHWLLCPYDPQRSKRLLRFDIAFPVDEIAFQDGVSRTKLSDVDLNKSAANGIVTRMCITFEHGPFSWEVHVRNSQGIRCRDVFVAISNTFNEKLTLGEQGLVRDQRAVENAFQERCKLAPGRQFKAELSSGWKRVDVLLHQTIFLGLTQPRSRSDWVLNLGTLPHIPGLS